MKILTYNIHSGSDIDKKPTLDRIIDYIRNLDCEVICLQEVLYHQFIKIKKSLKLDGVFACNVNTPTMKYGVCIFSKKQISRCKHVFLSSKKEQRGFLSVELGDDDDKINIINTHLGLDKEERYTQIDEIIDYKIAEIGKCIICGDFNEKNININKLIDLAVYTNKSNLPTLQKYNARIDYIFVDCRMKIVDYYVDKIKLSDHYAIIGIIQ